MRSEQEIKKELGEYLRLLRKYPENEMLVAWKHALRWVLQSSPRKAIAPREKK